MKKSKFVKLLSILLCVVVMIPAFSVSAGNDSASEAPAIELDDGEKEEKSEIKDKKIYSTATMEDDFADDCVLVVLDKSLSSVNKVHSKSFFGSTGIKSVVDLTAMSDTSMVNSDEFRQIIRLELSEKGKKNVLNTIKKLEKIDGVVSAEPDYTASTCGTTSNDEFYGDQWGLEKINIAEAWDITTGSKDVLVGIIDSGIASHPDLNSNVTSGWDFCNNNSVTTDDIKNHGTPVAGIIGAVANNSEGIAGVARNVTLVPLQVVSNNGEIDTSDIVEAVSYATENNIQILNMSMSSSINSNALKQAIANYHGLLVCSAENFATDLDAEPRYPASYNLANVISVAATTRQDYLWNRIEGDKIIQGSCYGANTVHLAAPGDSILSTVVATDALITQYYAYYNATSFATPFVTGVAALIKSIRPDLSATEIKALILDNVDPVEALEDKCITGGRLNAHKAVRAATEAQTFTGDVNGDSRADIILSRKVNGKRALTVYLGKSDGGFWEPRTMTSSRNFFYSDPAFVGDFNGDGFTDVLIHWANGGKRQLLVYISKGSGSFYEGVNLSSSRFHDQQQMPCSMFVDDVNGDGKDDFIVHYRNLDGERSALVYKGKASSPYLTDATTDALVSDNSYFHEDPVYTGDFNGDGYADMLVHWTNWADKRQLLIYTGNSDGTFDQGVNLSSSRYHKPETYPTHFFVADVNGDDKDDFVVQWKNQSADRSNLVYLGQASSPYIKDASTDALTSTNDYIETDPVFVGDIDGNGRADMIVHWTSSSGSRQLLTYKANSNGTYNSGVNYSTSNSHNPSVYAGTFLVADINGDGRDDFIVKWKNGGDINFLTYRGTASCSFSSAVRTDTLVGIPYYNDN